MSEAFPEISPAHLSYLLEKKALTSIAALLEDFPEIPLPENFLPALLAPLNHKHAKLEDTTKANTVLQIVVRNLERQGGQHLPNAEVVIDSILRHAGFPEELLEHIFLFELATPTEKQMNDLIAQSCDSIVYAAYLKGYQMTPTQRLTVFTLRLWQTARRIVSNKEWCSSEMLGIAIIEGQFGLAYDMVTKCDAKPLPHFEGMVPVDTEAARKLRGLLASRNNLERERAALKA